jgi:hypothetical protein
LDVKLEKCEGFNLATKKKETLERYWVIADGNAVGFVLWNRPGFVIFTQKNIGPLEKERISEDVAALMESKTRGFSEPPDVPDEILNKEQGEEFYEFDQEDAAGEGSD